MPYRLLFIFSLIGGLLLIFSRLMGKYLYYLSGYLTVFSYLCIIIVSLIIAKQRGVKGWACFSFIIAVVIGMTLLYILFVLAKKYL